jgi:hypothetical protein
MQGTTRRSKSWVMARPSVNSSTLVTSQNCSSGNCANTTLSILSSFQVDLLISRYVCLADELSVDENDEISIRHLASSIVKVMGYPGKPEVRAASHRFRST